MAPPGLRDGPFCLRLRHRHRRGDPVEERARRPVRDPRSRFPTLLALAMLPFSVAVPALGSPGGQRGLRLLSFWRPGPSAPPPAQDEAAPAAAEAEAADTAAPLPLRLRRLNWAPKPPKKEDWRP
ncbi:hypothetical protein TASIC1_0006010000 [Trichoderma asperellum]|uniref:Uncharacterized protein n=1 Tax=Trichoderma asperellum TaxID=101201 RepID=A0A6V8QU89_TRIAP|nr:hypothetical protein TASIC1_0006010000 [Trichoderma asperellum]